MILHDDPLCTLYLGDCVEVMAELPAESVDAIVTDPPYGIGFMGKGWDSLDVGPVEASWSSRGRNMNAERNPDAATPGGRSTSRTGFAQPNPRCGNCGRTINGRDTAKGYKVCHCVEPVLVPLANRDAQRSQAWHEAWAREAFRVAKPGAHLLAFGGTRTVHRLAAAIEDAGWEIRDCLVWAYASGFPKSLDVSKAIDKAVGAERVVTGSREVWGLGADRFSDKDTPVDGDTTIAVTAPATPDAARWNGWGTALKPAWEPIVMARKPLRGTVAANVLAHGTGALNIDATRIGFTAAENTGQPELEGPATSSEPASAAIPPTARDRSPLKRGAIGYLRNDEPLFGGNGSPLGRWPANLLLTDPIFDGDTPGVVGGGQTQPDVPHRKVKAGTRMFNPDGTFGNGHHPFQPEDRDGGYGDSGTYSRFFLLPKASRSDREPVLRGQLEAGGTGLYDDDGYRADGERKGDHTARGPRENAHPTVKPLDLMRHLVRLVTPPGGTVLDCFLGSGTTAIAANAEGFRAIGIEKEESYLQIALARMAHQPLGLGLDVPAPTRQKRGAIDLVDLDLLSGVAGPAEGDEVA